MNPFSYSRASDANQAVAEISGKPQGKFLGGGTNLIDLMKMGVETPTQLIDVNRLPLGITADNNSDWLAARFTRMIRSDSGAF